MSSQGNLQGFPKNSAPVVDKDRGFTWTTAWLRFMMTMWARTGTAQGSGTVYTGMIAPFGMPAIPPGWAYCDGSAVDRTVFAALFSVVGTIWGAGDGVTTFNLPDLTNRFAVGNGILTVGNRSGSVPLTGGSGNGYAVVSWAIKT